MNDRTVVQATPSGRRTRLNRQQIFGFWSAWTGWLLDGMDSFVYALVMLPALAELLPKSGMAATPGTIGFVGSVLFALFLIGWGLAFIWGPLADRFGRVKVLAASIVVYAVFTGAAALSQNIWQLGACRLLAGIGIGGEWALAGTYIAESWPEDRRVMGAGYLSTGYYGGFFLAALLNYTVGVHFGWRAMFLCGLAPAFVGVLALFTLRESERWSGVAKPKAVHPLFEIFSATYRKRTIVNATLLAVAIVGLWAGSVYEPTALIELSRRAGLSRADGAKMASIGTGVLSVGTILGCLCAPLLAEKIGRKWTLAAYFIGMMVAIPLAFGWAFYLPNGLFMFVACLFVLGFAGGDFAVFAIWLPEQYGTRVRATAFTFNTSSGRFIGAGVNFIVAVMVVQMKTLGAPIALTALAFAAGLLIIPFSLETRGAHLPP